MDAPVKGNGGETEATCGTCPYWYRIDKDSGLCRLLPPRTFALKATPIMGIDKNGKGVQVPQYNITPIFPSTGETWWCGKHPERDPVMALVELAEGALTWARGRRFF